MSNDLPSLNSTPPKLRLPKLADVRLKRFSLFAAHPDAEFAAGDGVLCLVGANGIGKSTLLAAINFCLTGTVPDPTRTFESINEYYQYTRRYSREYFRGRIAGLDEDDAEISVTFSIGPFNYALTRGLFEAEELRHFAVLDARSDNPSNLAQVTEDIPRSERHKAYADILVRHSGVSSFEEFVFLQHFLFTFDEQRQTLFWNQRIMERVLYRAFGTDPDMAKRADSIRREIDAEDSRVRNRQWEATRMRRRINEIRAKASELADAGEQFEMLASKHEQLSKQHEEETEVLQDAEDALRDAHSRLADLSVKEAALRDNYTQLFNQHFDLRPTPRQHPLVIKSIEDQVCYLCGGRGEDVARAIATVTASSICPMCKSHVDTPPVDDDHSAQLEQLDREIRKVRNAIRDVHAGLESLKKSAAAARGRWNATKECLDAFDRDNGTTLEMLRHLLNQRDNQRGHNVSLADHRTQLAAIEKDKSTAQERRDRLKHEQRQLQTQLQQHYVQVEGTFVPRFSALAREFLGMPLSVQLDARRTGEVRLVAEVRGTTRRHQQQLSESQRFFLDIALRMAFAQHMTEPTAPGGMFIDTPEGSLDIAYEKRAGDMLASFAGSGHQVIMTANVNTSNLVLALARRCRHAGMRICKMTDWAELSEVQREEEDLFDRAYAAIEEALGS